MTEGNGAGPPRMTVVVQLDQVFAQVMLHSAAAKILPTEYLRLLESDMESQIAQQAIADLSPEAQENHRKRKANLKAVKAFHQFRRALDSASAIEKGLDA